MDEESGNWPLKYAIVHAVDLLGALRLLSSPDEGQAREAMDFLVPYIRVYVMSRFRQWKIVGADEEDCSVEVCLKVFNRRKNLNFDNENSLRAYLKGAAYHVAVDHWHQKKKHGQTRIDIEDGPGKGPLMPLGFARHIEEVANEIWLGTNPEMSRLERKRRIVAAQLFLINNKPVKEIEELLHVGVDDSLRCDGILKALCYHLLYRRPDSIASHVLSPDQKLSEKELDDLAYRGRTQTGPSPCGDLTWEQVHILLLRFRNGLNFQKIVQICPHIPEAFILTTISAALDNLPFEKSAREIKKCFDMAFISPNPICDKKILKRLAFQYCYIDDIPQLQILERTEPIAKVSGAIYNKDVLTQWLSGKRLIDEIKEKEGDSNDES